MGVGCQMTDVTRLKFEVRNAKDEVRSLKAEKAQASVVASCKNLGNMPSM